MSSEEFMRKEFTLNLDSLTDLEEFVRLLINKISADVDGCYEHQIVDAKSFMGMVSISTHPVMQIWMTVVYIKLLCAMK